MPLQLLAVLVVGGIGGIALLLHVLGLSRVHRFATPDEVRSAWADEFPTLPATRVILSADRTAALVETEHGPGIIWPMGADSTARLLTGARVTRRHDGLVIRLPDYTAPRIRLRLDPGETDLWLTAMESPA